jgi:murein DD-endopeptidase MepM/ murein hydrolase activator NlpD
LGGGSGVVAYASHNGTVTDSGGNYIILEGDGYMTAYGHIEPFYGDGAYLVAGQPLGVVDWVGHLHFELWVGGDPVMAGDIASYF